MLREKPLVLCTIAVLCIAGVIPALHGAARNASGDVDGAVTGSTVIFADDFDDNSKDHGKWTEIYDDGAWMETSQRCVFRLYEPGQGAWFEGIESTAFSVTLNPAVPLNISWDLHAELDSTNWAGRIYLNVTDGTDWIRACYHRFRQETYYRDSNDATYTVLNQYRPWGSWSNLLQIYSDRYVVQMGEDGSGPVHDELFSGDMPLKVQIYVGNSGSQPSLYMRSGFDDIRVVFDMPETHMTFLSGQIDSLRAQDGFVTFTAARVRALQLFPFSLDTYTSGETVMVVGPYLGIVTPTHVYGLFPAAVKA